MPLPALQSLQLRVDGGTAWLSFHHGKANEMGKAELAEIAALTAWLGEQRGEAGAAAGRRGELVGVGPALGEHGHRLAAPDQLRDAEPKVPPAAQEDLGGRALGAAVPAFHRMDGDTVTDGLAVDLRAGNRLREGIAGARFDGVL